MERNTGTHRRRRSRGPSDILNQFWIEFLTEKMDLYNKMTEEEGIEDDANHGYFPEYDEDGNELED